MRSINRCTFLGRVGKEVNLSYTKAGTAYLRFSIACSENYKDKNGDWQEATTWVPVVAFQTLAENASTLTSGQWVHVEGKLRIQKEEKDGQKKTYISVLANVISLAYRDYVPKDQKQSGGGFSNMGQDTNEEIPF